MKKTYSFLSDSEQTDKQLEDLMREVGKSVRQRAKEADIKMQEHFKALVRAARERQHIYENKLKDV